MNNALPWKNPCADCVHLLDPSSNKTPKSHYVRCGIDVKDLLPEAFRTCISIYTSNAGCMTRKSVYGPFTDDARVYNCRLYAQKQDTNQ